MSLIQEIGSYAGLAAIPGLAILSALYFSQARDVRRLRDWAGRAPERAAEQAQGGRVVARPAGQPAAQPVAQPAAKPAAEPAAQPVAEPAVAATSAATPATAAAAAGAGAATASAGGGGTATAAPPRVPGAATPAGGNAATAAKPANAGPPRIPPRVPSSSQTSVLGVGADPERDPWYRRLLDRLPAPRYLAILIVGILVVGGGIAFGITQLGKDSTPSAGQPSSSSASNPSSGRSHSGSSSNAGQTSTPISPGDVNVSVLNGTTTTGLANSTGTDLESKGYNVLNRLNGQQGTVAESVVEFTPGHDREARTVAKDLDIAQIEPASASNISLGGPDAEVIVVLGADKATSP
ncbi:MAG: hypothetical protein QOG63_1512 [Thermoleophilaceae bacterium]|nr:hypothetical protein [Thermoleophilaceae bacterium]